MPIVSSRFGTQDARNRQMGVSYYDFLDWREAARSFSDVALMAQPTFNVSEPGTAPERYSGAYVSAKHVPVDRRAGASSAADSSRKTISTAQRRSSCFGYSIWQSRYAGDPAVLGKTIKVNDLLATVVGVMPQGMQFPPNTDLWLPFGTATINRGQSRQARNYQVIARLADGVTIPQARSELATITARLARDYPQTNQGIEPTIVTLQRARQRGARSGSCSGR